LHIFFEKAYVKNKKLISMEDLIFYAVVIISVIVSVVNKFLEQKKEDSKRVIGKPENQPKPEVQESEPPTPFSKPANKTKKTVIPTTDTDIDYSAPNKNKSAIEMALENANKSGTMYSYTSLESSIGNSGISEEERKAFQITDDDNVIEMEQDDKKKSGQIEKKRHPLFDSKDDLKKAILYTAILEKKY